MRTRSVRIVTLMALLLAPTLASPQDAGREIYMKRCFWCHGERGEGDGPSATGMFPRPRDLVGAEYKIRSTPWGQLPTDEDLFRVISRGLPGTPMPGWEKILVEEERRQLVSHIKSLSPRFKNEKREPLAIPAGPASMDRGKEIFRAARCWLCHGESGRADGGITTVLNFEWGLPYPARDFTRAWTFKGGREPRDIYLRVTGGLIGTPMAPYQEMLSDRERWDVSHYVASLDQEPNETTDEFVVTATYREEIPDVPDAPAWQTAPSIVVPFAGQVMLDPPSRWWTPTVGSVTVRAIWDGHTIGFLLEWNDPTGPDNPFPDSALLQFAVHDEGKPYFLSGNSDDPVEVWQWQTGDRAGQWTATGSEEINSYAATFQVSSSWKEGRWRVLFRGQRGNESRFLTGRFVPVLFSIRDGANGEIGNLRAISTWLYTTLERPRSLRPWVSALVFLLGAVMAEVWILSRLT